MLNHRVTSRFLRSKYFNCYFHLVKYLSCYCIVFFHCLYDIYYCNYSRMCLVLTLFLHIFDYPTFNLLWIIPSFLIYYRHWYLQHFSNELLTLYIFWICCWINKQSVKHISYGYFVICSVLFWFLTVALYRFTNNYNILQVLDFHKVQQDNLIIHKSDDT